MDLGCKALSGTGSGGILELTLRGKTLLAAAKGKIMMMSCPTALKGSLLKGLSRGHTRIHTCLQG